MRTMKRSFALAALVAVPLVSQAIVIRHDVADSEYTNLGNSFSGVGRVHSGGTGTLLTSEWVITAAHVVAGVSSTNFTAGGVTRSSSAIFVNPGYNPSDLGNGMDIALIRLSTAITNTDTYWLYSGTDELSQIGTAIGFGETGTGLTGRVPGSGGTKRAGHNALDEYLDSRETVFLTDFDSGDANDNFIGDATPEDLEFNVAPGDSGGSLMLFQNGQWKVAGITSFYANLDGVTNGDYGDFSGFMRINSAGNKEWIEQVTAVPEPTTLAILGLGAAALLRRKRK